MTGTITDPCMLIWHDEDKLAGIGIAIGTERFMNEKGISATNVKAKTITDLNKSGITINGSNIKKEKNGNITLSQSDKVEKDNVPENEKEFISQRVIIHHIGVK